jgi:[NiFe] hydrogenase diaphorase moiety large subunit
MQQFIQNLVQKNANDSTRLLQILREIQAHHHCISIDSIEQLAELLDIPRTQIISVVEFYNFLHLQPQGQYEICISDSITDHMLGKNRIMDYLAENLQVGIGHTRGDGRVSLHNTSCTGLCDQGPAGLINGRAISSLSLARINTIIALIEKQKPLSDWPEELFQVKDNIQKAELLLNTTIQPGAGIIKTFQRGLQETLKEIEKSGLRGRGGAGFKTEQKWRFCQQEKQTQRYVICNADEGEPGTFKDRVLLNTYAEEVFEGMTIAAAIVGATQGFVYLRAEYQYLYVQLENVLEQRRQAGLLGRNILGKNFDFDIQIHLGAGAYICGEESALIESLEGKRGIPRNRPPYPVTEGYLNKPTIVNNVETFVAAAKISAYGGDWFAAIGTAQSKGTKILSISGDCQRPGIYEYAFGTTIVEILTDCGARDVLGIQMGGPSGTFISNGELQRRLAFEDLATGGSFIIFNKQRNIFDIVRNFTHFFAHESCGFCTPCRVGTTLLKKQFDKIYLGYGSAGDVVELEQLGRLIQSTSHCGLGQTAANPMLTTLERFPELYTRQLKKINFEPGFDLDASLETARQLTNRDDPGAHLSQLGE